MTLGQQYRNSPKPACYRACVSIAQHSHNFLPEGRGSSDPMGLTCFLLLWLDMQKCVPGPGILTGPQGRHNHHIPGLTDSEQRQTMMFQLSLVQHTVVCYTLRQYTDDSHGLSYGRAYSADRSTRLQFRYRRRLLYVVNIIMMPSGYHTRASISITCNKTTTELICL